MRFTASEENVKITGRTLFVDGVRYLGYSGSSISFRFTGKRATARIWSNANEGGESLNGWIAVYVNVESEPVTRICLDREESDYVLYESDRTETVTITIMKYSEAAFGKCGIRSIEIDGEMLPPPPAKARKMEIIGDSITCGYGVEAPNELTSFHTATENPTKSYSLLTAKMLDTDVNLVSWSGNGIISGYVEESATAPSDKWLMPEVYTYTDISGSEKIFAGNESKWEKWDFARFVPNMILVNLGTNDCSWCRDYADRKVKFREKYGEFLKYIREHNPEAQILCMLGTMDQRVLTEVGEAVAASGDAKIHFLPLPAQNPADGYGADWHPSPVTHRKTAEIAVGKVKQIMNW